MDIAMDMPSAATIFPAAINGRVLAPASKSLMQRAIAAALLAPGESIITNASLCGDSQVALALAKNLGATVTLSAVGPANHDAASATRPEVTIRGGFAPRCPDLTAGESALALRMFLPILALGAQPLTITGQPSLRRRPVGPLLATLQNLGARAHSQNGFPPVTVCGPLRGGESELDGRLSSQFLTGLLLALPCCPNDSQIAVRQLRSRGYIAMTLDILQDFGIHFQREHDTFWLPGRQRYQPRQCLVEGDWSGAAFLLVAGALAGQIELAGLTPTSLQPDRAIIGVLQQAGAKVELGPDSTSVSRQDLRAFAYDASDTPDLFPPLVALAAHCPGQSRLEGVSRLKFKESDRALTLQQEFARLGVNIAIFGDTMLIDGGAVQGGECQAHNDHRLAMAIAVAALAAQDAVNIHGVECVAKSYPDFFCDLVAVGAQLAMRP